MKVNEFTIKMINKTLPQDMKLIDIHEEKEKERPFATYYHSRVAYRDTIVYCETEEKPNDPEATPEEMVEGIKKQIKKFEEIIENNYLEHCMIFLTSTIRVRYFKEKIRNLNERQVSYRDWEKEFNKYVTENFEKIEKTDLTLLQAYDMCVRNFKKDIVKRAKI